ncbi:Gamma-glutamyltranspeptidase [uncultured spirochete]|jgi:gamma-glutamyltranspeptidase/glutathione hydrolase|uniref:Glutathione hydrolase proenzyme n=1 Tax=uncultured spirochete TaxID=156406 RepID=A0A3P3XJD7_9SPIR|nr:Gamma-glutamyltranspeptidase [uncultured spirochete]
MEAHMKKLAFVFALFVAALSALSAQLPVNLYGRAASGPNGVVAAAKPEASQVGIDILKKGGNAVDAAVATGFALGVLEPNASGVGGGGFMIIKMKDMTEPVVIDFREMAPSKSTPTMYLGADGKVVPNSTIEGGLAVGVPGEVKGLLYALEHYGSGKLSRADIIQPAIQWALTGVPVTVNLASIIKDNYGKLVKYENGAQIYLKDGLPYEVGDVIYNPDLAKTLAKIVKEGTDAVYKGEIAEAIVKEVQKRGGILTLEDLANYEVKIRKPVEGSYRGYKVYSVPPASSGGTHLIEILNILENFDVKKLGFQTAQSAHLWSEILKLTFADRSKYMADTEFVKVPLAGLTSKEYAKEQAARIDLNKPLAPVTAGDPWKYESGSTTHFSVMDKEGNMVAVTKTINYFFGSGVTIPGWGFIMNDEMDDFVATPGSVNSVEPGKRPLSSMSPTLVLDPQGRSFMTIGSPGATRIFPTVAQVISNVIDFGFPIQEAILAPRVWQGASGALNIEGRYPASALDGIKKLGHDVTIRGDWDAYFGGVHAVVYDYDKGVLYGGADPRRDGQAAAF